MSQELDRFSKLANDLWDANWGSPKMYGFSLSSARPVILEAFHMEETYGDEFQGVTSEAENDARIVAQVNRTAKIWGPRATYVVAPARQTTYWPDGRRDVRLPRHCYRAWLTSKKMEKTYCGSELVVIWFDDRKTELSLLAMVELACRDVPWEKHARDFDY